MEKALLVAAIRNRIFNDQGTDIKAALSAAHGYMDTINNPSSRIGALTALHVVLNTVANAIDALPEYVNRTISLEDNPAAGAAEPEPRHVTLMLDRASLDAIIDARIQNWYENDIDLEHEVNRVIEDYDFSDTIRDTIRHNISFSVEVD